MSLEDKIENTEFKVTEHRHTEGAAEDASDGC
jgi:hypothetical protein